MGRNERAKVVLPAPLGPAMMMIFLGAGAVMALFPVPLHFHAVQMGRWQSAGLTEGK